MARPTPLDLVFGGTSETAFPTIRASLERGAHDPTDRDAFLLVPEVVSLLHELRPAEGIGEGMDQLAAFLHHAYLSWDAGALTLSLSGERLAALLREPPPPALSADGAPRAYYAQFLDRQVWATVIEGEAAEPMDGCFVHAVPSSELRVLGIFGVRPDRAGFSAVEASGPRFSGLVRPNGAPLFTPILAGGEAAGLFSLTGAEELLELGWRTRAVAIEASAAPR